MVVSIRVSLAKQYRARNRFVKITGCSTFFRQTPLGGLRQRLARSGSTSQQPFSAEVFVYFFPTNAITTAADLPIFSLLTIGIQQSWIPCERHSDRSAVHQSNA